MSRLLRLAIAVGLVVSSLAVAPGQALAVAPTDAPILLSPGDGSSVGAANPILTWSQVTGATQYRVQVSTTSNFSSLIYNATTFATKATPTVQLPFGTLWWRVAGADSGGNAGPYTQASFVETLTQAPVTLTPTDAGTLTFPMQPLIFSWNPVPGAISYTVQVSSAATFASYSEYTGLKNTSFTPTDTQSFNQADGTPQPWYWRVRANFPASISGPWSNAQSYSIDWPSAPELLSPPLPPDPLANLTDVVLSWAPVDGAQSYEVQISPNADFENLTINQTGVLSTRYSPYTTLLNGSYYWRVRARAAGSANNLGLWSTTGQFTRSWSTRPAPVAPYWDPLSPGNIPTLSNLEFSWTPVSASGPGWVDHASSYLIQISTSINFSGTPYSCVTNHTTFTMYKLLYPNTGAGEPYTCTGNVFNLAAGTTYYWRVKGIDAPAITTTYNPSGVEGLWNSTEAADTQRFVYMPNMPAKSAPADDATVSTPVLSWSPVSGAQKYEVYIRTKVGGVKVEDVTTYATTYTPVAPLVPGTDYEWSVWGIEGTDDLPGLLDDWWTFSVESPTITTNPPTPITIISPVSNAHSIRQPSMQWVPVAGADHYDVLYGTQSTIYAEPLGSGLLYAAFTYRGTEVLKAPLAAGEWWWKVVAYDSGGVAMTASAYQRFWVGSSDVGEWIVPYIDYKTPECVPHGVPSSNPCSPELGDTQELSWTADPRAGAYVVYVAKDAAFTNIYRRYLTVHTTLTPRESWADSQAGESYYWFVLPCMDWAMVYCGPGPDSNAGLNNASAYKKFSEPATGLATTSAENPLVPATTIANQITFHWRDYILESQDSPYPPETEVKSIRVAQEAKRYRIQVSRSADFGVLLDDRYVDQTQYTPWALTYDEGALYWRVQAYDGSDLALTMSATGSVTKSSPPVSLTGPAADEVVSGVPYFTWQPQNWAAKYEIEVYKNGDINWSPGNKMWGTAAKITAVASWSPTEAMPAGVYAWRVRRLDANTPTARPGQWSEGRLFTLRPDAPTLVSPPDGSLQPGGDMLFTWTGVPSAANYKFESSTSELFSSVTPAATTTSMTAWSPTTVYVAGTYYWRVKALDSSGNELSTSLGSRTFVVGILPGAPTGVTATAGNTTATVSWTAPASSGTLSITGYIVTSSPDGQICTTTGATTCTVGGLTNGTSYTFTVRAITDVGTGPASSASNAVVPTAVSTLEVVSAMVVTRDVAFNVTVRAVDSVGSLQSSYRGTIHFTSSDSAAILPSDYTFTVADAGQHTFTTARLRTYGTFSITATDKVTASFTGTRSGIQALDLPGAPTGVTATAGHASATVIWSAPASNGGSAITGYIVTSSPGGLTCQTSGATTCTVAALTNGTSYTFTVRAITDAGTGPASLASNAVVPLALDAFQVTSAPSVIRNVAFNVTVRAVDSVGTLQSGYRGSVHFTSTDSTALLPADYTFTPSDSGQHVFSVTLRSLGTLSITATDKANASVTGTASVAVSMTGATFVPLAPTRILDTREGNGLSGVFTSRAARTFQVTGRGGVPANAVAVTGNLTVTGQTAAGYLFMGPVATNAPTSSTLNFPRGDDRANSLAVKLGTGGTLSVTYYAASGARTHVIFDVSGYFTM